MRKMLLVLSLLVFSLIIVGDVLVASTITVSGAGSLWVDGVYQEQTKLEGRPFFQNGNWLISWNYSSAPNNWVIHNTNNFQTYYINSQNTAFPPQTGWIRFSSGINPAPTLSGDGTLAVEMTNYYAAFSRGKGVTLNWSTASEVGCAGFNIYKSGLGEKDYALITAALIPGHGYSSTENKYQFTDGNVTEGSVYYYKIEEVATNGERTLYGPISVQINAAEAPSSFKVYQNYPNPFNPSTKITMDLPQASHVDARVYDLLGNEVRILMNADRTTGSHVLEWNGRDGNGLLMPSGVYFYKLTAGDWIEVRKMIKAQ